MEASEHLYVGNSIQLTVANGDTTPASGVALELNSGPLTYGYIVALGGDFYGTPDITPISNAANPAEAVVAFKQAFATLDNANAAERNQNNFIPQPQSYRPSLRLYIPFFLQQDP